MLHRFRELRQLPACVASTAVMMPSLREALGDEKIFQQGVDHRAPGQPAVVSISTLAKSGNRRGTRRMNSARSPRQIAARCGRGSRNQAEAGCRRSWCRPDGDRCRFAELVLTSTAASAIAGIAEQVVEQVVLPAPRKPVAPSPVSPGAVVRSLLRCTTARRSLRRLRCTRRSGQKDPVRHASANRRAAGAERGGNIEAEDAAAVVAVKVGVAAVGAAAGELKRQTGSSARAVPPAGRDQPVGTR